MLKPIETIYRGCRFRSRLEARWAVVYDGLNLEWEYEPQGYVLPDRTPYLPDFHIKGIGWVEIKPSAPSKREVECLEQLVAESGEDGVMLCGSVPDPEDPDLCSGVTKVLDVFMWSSVNGQAINDESPNRHWFSQCFCCGRTQLRPNAQGCLGYGASQRKIRNALAVARAARFEHGERPPNL